MALPDFSMRQLLEAGVHYGHQTQRWNPRMAEFIYGERNGIHIFEMMDLRELAATGTREFLFIAAPLRLRGGTGSPINPLAILTP